MGEFREQFLAAGIPDTEYNRFRHATEHVRKRFPQLTVGTLSTFLAIAELGRDGELTPSVLAERLNLPFTTVYRQVDQLCAGARGQPGLGLIEKVVKSGDGRARTMKITLRGLQLLTELRDILSISHPAEP